MSRGLVFDRWRRRWWDWARGARPAPPAELTSADLALLEGRYPEWVRLTDAERADMQRLIVAFVDRMRWESARGTDLTPEMKVLIGAQACLLLLGLDVDEFPATPSIIVHGRAVIESGEREIGVGRVRSDGRRRLDGQAHYRGPVVLSWPAVERDLARPERGRNVVYHEFAHQLDMLDGSIDGAPPLGAGGSAERWVAVMSDAYERLRQGGSEVVRPYAGTNPGEFFAVATEAFFTRPIDLRTHEPDLFVQLCTYYGQDPARRAERSE